LDESDEDDSGRNRSEMPINLSMPKQCNSSTGLKQHLTERGLQIVSRECCDDRSAECETHRKYKITHQDHTDYLIHNESRGMLHMEHPCGECGENDVHGKFRLVHTRSWLDESSNVRSREGAREIRMHFFQEPQEPFRLLEVFAHLFELESSSRVHAVRVVDDLVVESGGGERRVGRSHLFVEKICCASESRQIKSLLGKVAGVGEVSVNTTTKIVYVDHDVDVISASGVADILNEQRFGASVKKDAASEMAALSGIPTDVFVVSKFCVAFELKMTETNDITKTLNVIDACLREKFSHLKP
jgi:copper chaperone CopZ